VVVDNGNFQHFCWLFLQKLDTQSVVGFSVIPEWMTLNDLDWLFRVKFCFRADLAGCDRAIFKYNCDCVKTNEARHTLSAAQVFGRDSCFCQYKVCVDIRLGSLETRR